MKRADCLQFFTQKGIRMQDQLGLGVWNGYPISIRLEAGQKDQIQKIVVRIHLSQAIQKHIRKELKQVLERRAQPGYTGTTLEIVIPAVNIVHSYEISTVLNTVTDFLAAHQLNAPTVCPVCGEEKPDVYAFYEGVFQPIHNRCLKRSFSGMDRKAALEAGRESYLSGAFGALIGMLVGMLPCALILLIHNALYAVLFAFVPICIYFGYKLLHGRFTNLAVVIMIVFSMIAFLCLFYIFLLVKSHNDAASGGLWFFKASFMTLFSIDGFKALYGEMLQSFIFLLIGIICSWRLMTDNVRQTTPQAIDFIQSTAIRISRAEEISARTASGRYRPIHPEEEADLYQTMYSSMEENGRSSGKTS